MEFEAYGLLREASQIPRPYNGLRRFGVGKRLAMAQGGKKRLGKKHRQASTRPKKGRAPKATPTTGAVDPRKRKVLSTKRALSEKLKRVPQQSPEKEKRRAIRGD